MIKGDVGMVNASLKSAEKWKSFQLSAIRKLCQDACQRLMLHPTSLPQQAAKTNMASMVRVQVFSIMHG